MAFFKAIDYFDKASLEQSFVRQRCLHVQSWTKIVSTPNNFWELLVLTPNFDTKRILRPSDRIRCRFVHVMQTDRDIETSFREELRQNLFSMPCVRRTRLYKLYWVQTRTTHPCACLTCLASLYNLVLCVLQALENDKSEDSSAGRASSHRCQTHTNKVNACYSIISSVTTCISFVLHVLFAFFIWAACRREISTSQNAGSQDLDMLSRSEKVRWDHNDMHFYYALRFSENRSMKFGP
jgi:hypothetical protein